VARHQRGFLAATLHLPADRKPLPLSAQNLNPEVKLIRVSIITVSFNSAETIRDTIDSVLAQDHKNIEYIVVDGASKDSTMAIVNSYGGQVIRSLSQPDRGIYDAMNTGIEISTGEIVGFINSDDFYASDRAISSVVRVFKEQLVDAVYGDLCYVRQRDTSRVVRYWRSSSFKVGAFSDAWCPPHPTFFVKRSVYEEFGGFDLNFKIAADVELMMRLLEVHRISSAHIPEVLVKMRMGGETNRSIQNIIGQNREIMRALRLHDLSRFWPSFIAHKVWSRIGQFIARPAG
jgi:glycosyltransferase involved in cell wall biosynthesis